MQFQIMRVNSVFTELFKIGVNRNVLFFYAHNSENCFVGVRVVEQSMEKGIEKSRQQGFPIDYRFNKKFSTHYGMSRKGG